jgi:long-chain acyl-CoA synthetase
MIPPERYESLGELLRDALVQYKSEVALIEANRKQEARRLTYLELLRESDRVARYLEDAGVGAGERVAICMGNQSKWIVAACAAFSRGAVVVPVDYKLTPAEQLAQLAHCTPRCLVTEWPVLMRYDVSALPAPHVLVSEAPEGKNVGSATRYEDAVSNTGPRATFVPRKRSDQATLVYSSGTGGVPKGCMLSHENYLEQYRTLGLLYPLRTGHRYFSILPTNHAIDFMSGFIGPLCSGATVVHQRSLRPEFINHSMERYGITHMAVVPLLLEAFEERIRERLEERGSLAEHVFDGLRQANAALTLRAPRPGLSRRLLRPVHDAFGGKLEMLFCGGAFVDAARAQFFYDLGIPVVIGYGLTEAGTVLTVNDLAPFRADSVGRPLDGVTLQIRNAHPETQVGEVWAKSRTVMLGYLNEPELTAETIVDGWLRTGDLGFLDPSGQLHLRGRSKNMIVTAGGKNVYPEDIEGAFAGVPCDELAVFATGYVWPGVALTEEGLIVVVRAEKLDDAAARNALLEAVRVRNGRLPDYKRVSGVLPFAGEFPRTASMKIKRAALADALRTQSPRGAILPVGA